MAQSGIPPTCTHERRPGTTTCLYCLQEERARQAAQRRRALTRAALGVVGAAIVIALAIGGFTALASDSGSVGTTTDSAAPPAPAPVVRAPPPRVPAVHPVIARGTRDLGEGVVATRADDEVTVTFDTDLLRTRFDWKFEAIVRSTLPRVYGEPARVALDSVPSGQLVRGDILDDLTRRGIPLALSGADTLMVWPVTRQGRDGPIVVAYRALSR